jgi:hypothetical protein
MLTRLIEIGYIMHHIKHAVSVCRSRIILSDNSKLTAYDNEAALWSHREPPLPSTSRRPLHYYLWCTCTTIHMKPDHVRHVYCSKLI